MRQTLQPSFSRSSHSTLEMEHLTQPSPDCFGAPLFRIQKPATPPQHLVSYFVLSTLPCAKSCWLTTKGWALVAAGGHVEPDEDPQQTVVREAEEELQITAIFANDATLFDRNETVGTGQRHVDVSLWYVRIRFSRAIAYDKTEFHGIQWFALDPLPLERCDHICNVCE